ncbi:glycosyl hydrolase family 28-related protein [Microvirga aerilata]|uniref:glycosyl hydrolase family 28-related protein n=1 Tax=Microvirga aerilata TaxID=670292 RepID=UPI00362FD334
MPTISTLDYGATPNNTTNDSAAINAAIRAANAQYLRNPSDGPVTVTLPAGTFIVSGTGDKSDGAIKLLTGTILQGAGMGQTILKVADGWAGDITGVVRTPTTRSPPKLAWSTSPLTAIATRQPARSTVSTPACVPAAPRRMPTSSFPPWRSWTAPVMASTRTSKPSV